MDIREVILSEIRPDFFFRFSGDRNREGLIRSVRRSGILTPLPVLAGTDGYRMIGGFGRWETARALNVKKIPVRLLDPEIPLWRHMLDEVAAHGSVRSFSLVEKARLLEIFEKLDLPESEFTEQLLPLIDLPDRPPLLSQVRAVLSLDDSVQAYIEKHHLSLRQAEMFRDIPENGQACLMEAAGSMQIRGVELASIIDMCRDVSGRDRVEWDDLISETTADVNETSGMTSGQRRQHWKENLVRRASPYVSEQNEALNALRTQLKMPDGGRVKWDAGLEQPGIVIHMHAASPEHLHAFIGWLNDAGTRQCLGEMIDRIR